MAKTLYAYRGCVGVVTVVLALALITRATALSYPLRMHDKCDKNMEGSYCRGDTADMTIRNDEIGPSIVCGDWWGGLNRRREISTNLGGHDSHRYRECSGSGKNQNCNSITQCYITGIQYCDNKCEAGKCLSASDICGKPNEWGTNGETPQKMMQTCVVGNEGALPSDYTTWKNIQGDTKTLEQYLLGVQSDKDWFINQFTDHMYVLSAADSDSDSKSEDDDVEWSATDAKAAADLKLEAMPAVLKNLATSCRSKYESFTCMRNLPGCKDNASVKSVLGEPDNTKCLEKCEAISTDCLGKFYDICKTEMDKAEAGAFTCKTAGQSECMMPWCDKDLGQGSGTMGQGWQRNCTHLCNEFQQNLKSAGAHLAPASMLWLAALLTTLLTTFSAY